jgi:muramoyltetrapeptide carboxypeptidase LdcA involved in peptidoglycan recycling
MTYNSPSCGGALLASILAVLFIGVVVAGFQKDPAVGYFLAFLDLVLFATAFFAWRGLKTYYYVAIASASGETQAVESTDAALIEKIVASINQAIARYR